jgi:hypothetical protein
MGLSVKTLICSLKGSPSRMGGNMARLSSLSVSPLMLVACLMFTVTYAHGQPPSIQLTTCGVINEPGDYVAQNDLVLTVNTLGYGAGGDCLVIATAHVKIDMQGYEISAVCPVGFDCPEEFGPPGGRGVYIMSGANGVAISNLYVDGFVYGIVNEAELTTINGAYLRAVVGITQDGGYSVFSGISYEAGDPQYHSNNGPVMIDSGVGYNTFSGIVGDVGGGPEPVAGVVINSNRNALSGINVSTTAEREAGAGIVISGDFNSVTNSSADVLWADGIEVGGNYNTIQGNSFTTLSPAGYYAAVDGNPNCGHDRWIDNTFSADTDEGAGLTDPVSCIH